MLKKEWRVAIIHPYPNRYIVDSLAALNIKVVFFSSLPININHSYLENSIQCTLSDWGELENTIVDYHQHRPFLALLPLYEGAVEITAIIAKKIGLFSIDLACAQAGRHKYLSYKCWEQSSLPTPKTIVVSDDPNQFIFVRDDIGYPAVLKLADSMNSQGVIRVNNDDECKMAIMNLKTLINRSQTISDEIDRNRNAYARSDIKILAQEFCEGIEVSVDLFCDGDNHVLGIYEKAPAPGPYFAETMSIYPTMLGPEKEKELFQLAIAGVKALGNYFGAAHVEMRYAKDGPKLLEIGLRPGGAYTVRAIEYLLNINLYQVLAKLYLGIPIVFPKEIANKSALYGGLVYPYSGCLKAIAGTEIFKNFEGLLDYQILNQIGDIVYALPFSAQPHFCYYLLGANTRQEVIDKHLLILNKLHIVIEANE